MRSIARCSALILMAASLFAPLMAVAAEVITVPYTLTPGTVTVRQSGFTGGVDISGVSLPITQIFMPNPVFGCGTDGVTITAEIVDGYLEIEADGFMADGCNISGSIQVGAVVQVPEFGGTATVMRMVPEIVVYEIIESSLFLLIGSFAQLDSST